jgi:glycosyltransferase involved in cell wall biosynthesis
MIERGLGFRRPVIIHNAVDPRYFYPPAKAVPRGAGRLRIISSAWSDNPRKGAALYRWLDERIDPGRFSYTFVGRIKEDFRQIRHVPPCDSRSLGALLREHDLYLTASQNDPCSNALLEAMACGLPALYLDQGGHGELVGFGGLPFSGENDVLAQLEALSARLDSFRACLWQLSIEDVARRYIDLARQVMEDEL